MLDRSTTALVAYGWSDRVLALFNAVDDGTLEPVRVVRVERGGCIAVGADGVERPLVTHGAPAVGDWGTTSTGELQDVLPRWSEVTRADPSGVGVQVLAANVDLVIITAPADRLSVGRVERELVIAWDSGAQPLVVLTKADLGAADAIDELTERLVGVDVVATSTISGAGIADVELRLPPGVTAVLIGPSGAGKSTLANALLRTDRLAIGAVRDADQRGRHTTTSRQMVTLPCGGVLIDTPGLRSLGLAGGESVDVVFPEIEALAAGCRFADCQHESEPDCAVAAAAASGELDSGRLASYRKLQREIAADARKVDPLLRKAQLSVWKSRIREAKQIARRKQR